MKVRPASAPSLDHAMANVVEIADRAALMAHLRAEYSFWSPTDDNVSIRHYGRDARIGWDTHLVTVAGHAALFTDGPLPEASTP